MANPLDIATVSDVSSPAQQAAPVKDTDQPAYQYAKALCETARAGSVDRMRTFKNNWDFFVGKGHFKNWPHQTLLDMWQFRGVINWTYATIRTKASMLTSAQSDIFVDPLDENSTYLDRLLIKSANEHEATRTRFQQVKEDVFISGSVTGVGISMYTAKPDPLTGAMALAHTPIRSDEFARDPSADSITSPNCRFVTWFPLLDMSTVRQMFPSKASKVKPESRAIESGGWTYKPDNTDSNLFYGSAGEFAVDRSNVLYSRKARVYFVWIKDESVVEDLQNVLLKPESPGYVCDRCDQVYDQGVPGTEDGMCPECGGNLQDTTIPAKYEQSRIIRRAYPYGRLIVYSGDTLLFDGENPYELENVFPFAVYHHDRIPGDFYGGNDVELLEALQDAMERSMAQLVDYVRLGANSPILYPADYKSISEMGNGPSQRLPGPKQLPWQPFRLPPTGFDTSSWQALYNALYQNFQIVSGLSQAGLGQTSAPPISATEAEIANARLSDRMKGHATELSQWGSDALSIQDQMARQFYTDSQTIAVTFPDSTIKATEIEWSQLPKARVRVMVSPERGTQDKLVGQNVMMMAQQPGLLEGPLAPFLLGKIGASPAEIKELQDRAGLQKELLPPGAAPSMGPPTGGPQPPLQLVPPQTQPQAGGPR